MISLIFIAGFISGSIITLLAMIVLKKEEVQKAIEQKVAEVQYGKAEILPEITEEYLELEEEMLENDRKGIPTPISRAVRKPKYAD